MKQYDKPYNTQSYRELLYKLKDLANWTCSKCYWVAKSSERIEIVAHHINKNPLDNNVWNVIVLCRDCHDIEHEREISPKRKRIVAARTT